VKGWLDDGLQLQVFQILQLAAHRRRGGRPQNLKNVRANSVFKASASCSNILNDKKYIFNTVKNSRAILFFRASASCSKILNNKKYIFRTVNSGQIVFQGKLKFLKYSECKKYIQYSKKFQGNSVFQGKRKLLKNPE